MFAKFKVRSTEEEIMDDLDLDGEEMEDALVNLERVNNWLQGNAILVKGFKELLAFSALKKEKDKPLVVRDIGCGGGDGLRAIAEWGRKQKQTLQLEGHDANAYAVKFARERSLDYPEISFEQKNILAKDYDFTKVDVVCCGLFLHHFREEEQLALLRKCFDEGVQAILINDLHRHWLAYYLFRILCTLLRVPKITIEDGSLSVRRAFKREELENLIKKLEIKKYTLNWRWAFRYRAILFN